jgi:lactate permease
MAPAGLAILPILAVLALMVGARWPAARAGVAGLAITVVVAVQGFGYGTRVLPEAGPAGALGGAMLEAAFVAATILWIVFPAFCIHRLQQQTGAMDVLRHALARLSGDPRVSAVLVAWFFALFIEGAAGFGAPVALAAPFLVGVGFAPVPAVAMALVGHSVGVSFGSVGIPALPLEAAAGVEAAGVAPAIALYHALLGWVMLGAVILLVGRARPDARGPLGFAVWAAAAAALFLVPFYAIARWVGPELPSLGGALLGGLAFVALVRLRTPRRGDGASAQPPGARSGELVRAAAPYLALVAFVLATRLVDPLRALFAGVRWEWSAGAFQGAFHPLYHPGTALVAGLLAGALWQGAGRARLADAARHASAQMVPVAVALVAMLGLSRIMVHAGMIDVLSAAAAHLAGGAWPLVAPAVGVLGSFVTGSATASNILLGDFQAATARALGLPLLAMIGAQGFGAAVGNVISPHNVIAGCATVGLAGREAEVMRLTLVPCLVYAALGGVLAFVLAR